MLIRILIAAAGAPFRKSLRRIVGRLPGVKVIGESTKGLGALGLVNELRPDLAVLDFYLPGIDGWHAAPLIREFHPATRVIIIASDDSNEHKKACLTQGADGFVSRSRWRLELAREIHRVLDGAGGRKLAVGAHTGNFQFAVVRGGRQRMSELPASKARAR